MGFDTTRFPFLNFRDEAAFWRDIERLKKFFQNYREELQGVFKKGAELKAAFLELDPLVEELTNKICPYCGTVCCANRHGFPEFADIVSMLAMEEEIPKYDLGVDERDLCQFLSRSGCILPRYRRPYRCTWYFCDPMLVEVDIGPIKRYRNFLRLVTLLSQKRGELLEEFFKIYMEKARPNDPPGKSPHGP